MRRVCLAAAALFAGCSGTAPTSARIAELEAALCQAQAGRLLAEAELTIATDPGSALAKACASAGLMGMDRTDQVLQQALDALHERRTLLGHGDAVLSVDFSADGERILTTSDDGTARVWRTSDGGCELVLEAPDSRIVAGDFSPDGRRIVTQTTDVWNGTQLWDAGNGAPLARLLGACTVSFSADGERLTAPTRAGTVTVWDASGKELALLQPHGAPIASAVASADGATILSAATDGTAKVTRVDGATSVTLAAFGGPITIARFDPAGARILTASPDRTAKLWEARTGRLLHVLGPCPQPILDATFNADGTLVVTASAALRHDASRLIAVWDATTGQLACELAQPQRAFALGADDVLLTAGVDDPAIVVRDARSGREQTRLLGHTGVVHGLSLHPHQPLAVSGSADGSARLWWLRSLGARRTLPCTTAALAIACPADGKRAFIGEASGTVQHWVFDGSRPPATLEAHDAEVYSVDCTADGARVVTASQDARAIVWDVETGLEQHLLQDHDDVVRCACFRKDGARVLTASLDATAALWDAGTGERVATLRGHEGMLNAACFDADGDRIATASNDGTARLWSGDGELLHVLLGHRHAVTAVAFSGDGRTLLTAGDDRTARSWCVDDGRALQVFTHDDRVTCVLVLADATRVHTGDEDGVLRTFDGASGRLLVRRDAHGAAIASLHASADGSLLLTAADDGLARLWRASDSHPMTTFRGHTRPLTDARFVPGGTHVLTTSLDATARLWPIDRLREARAALPRPR